MKEIISKLLSARAALTLLILLLCSSVTRAQATLTVNDGTTENEYVPLFGYYCDKLIHSQFIIPSTSLEDMTYGTVNAMTFYSTTPSVGWGSAAFDVFVKEVTETTFSDTTLKDWRTMEKIYSGSLSIDNDGKMTVSFSAPFQYMGGNLLIGINQTASGPYKRSMWVGIPATGASLGGQANDTQQRNFLPKTTFDYTPGEVLEVDPPTDLVVSYTGGTTAEVSWTSTESAFDIDVNGVVTENVTNPYSLTNLQPATTYFVKVRAKRGSDVSYWSAPAVFSTELSSSFSTITFELTDSYGDGWNGASIQVEDALTGTIIGSVTNVSGQGQKQTYTMDVPAGHDIVFVWVSGNYDSECSYTVCDEDGNVIFSGLGTMTTPFTYHVASPKPTDVSVTPLATSATATWTGNEGATSYNLRYRVQGIDYDFELAEPWAVDDFSPFTTYDGDGLSTYGISNASFTNQGYTGSLIAFQNGTAGGFTAHSGQAFGCFMNSKGSSPQNNDWLISPEVEVTQGMIFSFWLRSETDAYGLERFKVGIYGDTDGTFASYLAGSASTYVEAPTQWTKYEYDLSAYVGQTVKLAINCVSADAFALFIDDIHIGSPWETVENVASPYELTDLTAETDYELQVQTVYAAENSSWTSSTVFATLNSVILEDAQDNSDVLALYDGKTVGAVTLSGRTLYKDNTWNTLCLPFDVPSMTGDMAGATLMELDTDAGEYGHITGFEGGTLYLNFKPASSIEAGKPYIVRWESGSNFTPTFTGVTITNTAPTEISSADSKMTFVGSYAPVSVSGEDKTMLYMGADNKLYYPNGAMTINAFRAHIRLDGIVAGDPSDPTLSQIRAFMLNFGDGSTTGIVEMKDELQKTNDSMYDLQGRRLSGRPTVSGIYIKNGKKVVIR